jgi:hypothetical protein
MNRKEEEGELELEEEEEEGMETRSYRLSYYLRTGTTILPQNSVLSDDLVFKYPLSICSNELPLLIPPPLHIMERKYET